MKFKSLLLGSAAAMMAVSGVTSANAADAVFAAEPEPMEYVKVCDTYGKGFFYIPGTETCLKLSGYVRVEYIYNDKSNDDVGSFIARENAIAKANVAVNKAAAANLANPSPANARAEGRARNARDLARAMKSAGQSKDYSNWVYRARVNFDARNETDWGTLRSQIRFQGDGNTGDGNVSIDRALISLGGLRLGYSDSYFVTHHNYGWRGAANDGYYDYHQAIFLDYTFAANGFSATVGVQDASSKGVALSGADDLDPYAGASYAGSWGRLAGSLLYDNSADELAWKVSAEITAVENLTIAGWFMADNGGTRYVTGGTGADNVAFLNSVGASPEWQWGVSAQYQINSQFSLWGGYTDFDTPSGVGDLGRFGVGANWTPVSGLSIRPEAVFGSDDYMQVRLRVVRSF